MNTITVQTTIVAPVRHVWDAYTQPEHIVQWAFASEEWECPEATNDVRVGGEFHTHMAAKDKSAGFDFSGTYTEVQEGKLLQYTMSGEDARKVEVQFEKIDEDTTMVTVIFDPESINPIEMQKAGWQAILDNFKKHVERK